MIGKKRFCFVLYTKFRQNYQKEKAVKKRLDLSYIHSRQGNIDIRSRRGSGLFISGRAFGDALYKINCTSSCAFLCLYGFYYLPQRGRARHEGRDRRQTMSHVGQMIKAELDRQPKARTATWLAEQLHCKRTNVYNIFNRPSVDTALLERISRILEHDFFLDLPINLNKEEQDEWM